MAPFGEVEKLTTAASAPFLLGFDPDASLGRLYTIGRLLSAANVVIIAAPAVLRAVTVPEVTTPSVVKDALDAGTMNHAPLTRRPYRITPVLRLSLRPAAIVKTAAEVPATVAGGVAAA